MGCNILGYSKSLYMEQQERGYSSVGNKFVCRKCIGNKSIQKFIKENLKSNHCDYCNTTMKSLIAADLDDVIGFILDGINTEWEHPVDCMGRDEGDWIGNYIDSDDLIRGHLWDDLEIENDQLNQDIIDSFNDDEWCELDPYALRPHEHDYYTWEQFSDLTKYQIRYVFFRTRNSRKYDEIGEPYKILERIGSIISELELIKTWPKNTQLFRTRPHNNDEDFTQVEDLGPPSKEKTRPNRMSPAGIVMFYGALDQKTAIAEVFENNSYVTIATFKTLKRLNVLDLTSKLQVPSLFDQEHRYLRNAIIFLREFIQDITKPIPRNGIEDIEYVPTQIVTEFFRHIYKTKFKKKIDGIIYPSSRDKNGKNCVLFVDQKKCTQDNRSKSNEDLLCLTTNTIKKIKI
jgi:hypothetical protein